MNADKAEFQSERIKYMAQNDTRHTFNLLSKHNDLFFVENPGEADAALSFVGAGRINSLRNYTIERRKSWRTRSATQQMRRDSSGSIIMTE